MKKSFTEIIAIIGTKQLAARLNKPEQTVYSWRRRNTVPVKMWPELIRIAPEYGIDYANLETFYAIQIESQRR